ncbi:arginase family protein [Aestuariivirga sp. YIM B02566]|uniref:Arginase family protein n=1 Tax=Taklimakanibacter albus TaxID=2800327 RepID=A0ACC5QZ15_9HYPH|nr:arginase family protein [Aestuariivirga sp. YIM B02566]MBK1865644.1 arginase family protein [Aestuariivirga sp. YIM B02566]
MPRYQIIEAPSVLGLWPSGVQDAPRVLLEMGLGTGLGLEKTTRLEAPHYDPRRDPKTKLLNPAGLLSFSQLLAREVWNVIEDGATPIVLGGDCSILLGPALALRQRGRHGLLFADGHMDYWDAALEPYGEAASMDLALVTGRGPALLSNIDGLGPYFEPADCVAYGTRDHLYSSDFVETPYPAEIMRLDVQEAHALGAAGVDQALARLTHERLQGFWIHFDVDVLDDKIMSAVDYRMENGLSFKELERLLGSAFATGKVKGMTLTIYNPNLDPQRLIARQLVGTLLEILQP